MWKKAYPNVDVKGECEKIVIAENSSQLDFAIIKISQAPLEKIFLKDFKK